MPNLLEAEVLPQANQAPKTWKTFFQVHSDALFQTALLLSADPEEAEASIAAVLDTVDLCEPPAEAQLSVLQEKLAQRSIQTESPSERVQEASCLLQAGLRPVLQIERFPRVCFVLRALLGYATSSCAQTLGIEETAVRTMLRIAILQLHSTTTGASSRRIRVDDSIEADGRCDYPTLGCLMNRAAAHC